MKEKSPKTGGVPRRPDLGKNKDSFNRRRCKQAFLGSSIYNEGDITYQNSNLNDYMQINMANKMVYAYGKPDQPEGKPIAVTKPEFSEGDASRPMMDTITT